ncbi:S-methylmethionine permease mmp1 [Orbilia oligospora]|uniref:S-methylmethionine permease mmp1 n=1 Tax=Orbilia oligospora TaxID=2813651 RepID=A0A7C8R5I5_ORBOL|nr:S-methylmethionine permease mmp1 [Orbilia oligospora]
MAPPTVEEVAEEAGPAIKNILTHLACYGCLPSDSETEKLEVSGPLRQYAILSMGIAGFQSWAGLPETGVFDVETANHFNQPHCHSNCNRSGGTVNSAYAEGYTLKNKKTITYCFNEYSGQLSVREIRDVFEKAFKDWEDLLKVPIIFMEVAPHPGKGNIRISWANSGGGGESGPVFVSYPPPNSVDPNTPIDMYFDEDTKWTVENLRKTVLHQVGHILGIVHSSRRDAVMWPAYRNEIFGGDDRSAIYRWNTGSSISEPPAIAIEKLKDRGAARRNKEERVWTCILQTCDKHKLKIIAAPGGVLYRFSLLGNIWRYKTGETWERIAWWSGAKSPTDIQQLVTSSDYLYRLNEDGTILRYPHDKSGSGWYAIDSKESGNKKIAACPSSPLVYKCTNLGNISVWREDAANIFVLASEVIYNSGHERKVQKYEEVGEIWTSLVIGIPFQKIITGPGDHSFYIISTHWGNPGEVFEVRPNMGGLYFQLGDESRTRSSDFLTYPEDIDFVVSGSHRYTVHSYGPAEDKRRGVVHNGEEDRPKAGSHKWVDLKPPSSISQLVAAEDDVYYIDDIKSIFKMSMG